MLWHCYKSIWKFGALLASADYRRHEIKKSKISFFESGGAYEAHRHLVLCSRYNAWKPEVSLRILCPAIPGSVVSLVVWSSTVVIRSAGPRSTTRATRSKFSTSSTCSSPTRLSKHCPKLEKSGLMYSSEKFLENSKMEPLTHRSHGRSEDTCLTPTTKPNLSSELVCSPLSSFHYRHLPSIRSEYRGESPYLTTISQIYRSPLIFLSLLSSNCSTYSHSHFTTRSTTLFNFNSILPAIVPQSCGEPKFLGTRLTINKLSHSPFLAKQLLVCGDVEVNPGPGTPTDARNSNSNDKNHESDLQVVSYNVRGLGEEKKCRHLINYLNKTCTNKNVDVIIALQETLIQTPLKIPYLWRGNMHLTPGTGNGRGCISLVSSHLNVISHLTIDDRAHVIALQKTGDLKVAYIVANIYAPNAHNEDKLVFFEEVLDKVAEMEERFECNNVIMLGDFNLIFKESEKVNRAFSGNEKRVATTLGRMLHEADLHDAWADRDERRMEFTWRRPNSNSISVLDRVMYRKTNLECLRIKSNWG